MPPETSLGRYATSATLLVSILLFLLPFTEIRCNDKPFASNTGLGLALGKDYKVNDDVNSLTTHFNDDSSSRVSSENENGRLYVAALAALLLGIAGFVYSLVMERSTITSIITSLLAACALIILMVQIKQDVNEKSISPGQVEGFNRSVKIVAVFTIWYYLALLSFLLAAFISYQRWRSINADTTESATVEQMS
jgi:hypothetical protein